MTAGPALTRGGRALSLKLQACIQTLTAGDGPHSLWLVGLSLSLAQFEQYLENQGPVQPKETAKAEIATRGKNVRYLGLLVPVGNGTISVLSLMDKSLSGLKWTEEDAGFQFIIYNEGIAMTTGALARITAQFFVEWNASG